MAKRRLEPNESGKRYFILGKNASVFWDPKSKLKVTTNDPAKPTLHEGKLTNRVLVAIQAAHIVEVDEPQPTPEVVVLKAPPAPPEPPVKKLAEYSEEELKALVDEELLALYKAEFDVSPKDEKAFLKKTKEEKVAFLTEEE